MYYNFNSPKSIVYGKINNKEKNKQTTPQTNKESSRISDPADDENERIRRGLMSTTYYTNYEHTERKLKKESSMYEDPRKSGGRL